MTSIAVLGTGIIGAPIARNLRRAGFDVTAWNRTASKSDALADGGIRIVADVESAARGADVIVTVLKDADSVLAVLDQAHGGLSSGTVLVQMSTVGVAGIERIADAARERHLRLIDAPVLGTKGPAEAAQLVVLASGDTGVRDVVAPLFDAIAKKALWISDEAGAASKLKLVVNNLVSAITHGVAESIVLAEALDIDPALFIEATAGGPLESAFGSIKAKAIVDGDFAPSFTVANAVKDSLLVVEAAASSDVWLPQAAAGLVRYSRAAELGHGDSDMAATYYAGSEQR